MLPPTPNKLIPSSLKKDDSGWPTFGLQSALNVVQASGLALDGDFGPATDIAVSNYQRHAKLKPDGIAGSKTMNALCAELADGFKMTGIPIGLGRSLIEGESGCNFGAVNWSVSGGVDCGIIQRRVFGPPYDRTKLQAAFTPVQALHEALTELLERALAYGALTGVKSKPQAQRKEYALRLALLAHNWPWAAQQLSKGIPLSTSKLATWVPASTRFDDKTPVRTYAEWAQFYALGGPHGPARMTRYVTNWPT